MEAAFAVGLGGAAGAILCWQVGVFMSHLLAQAFWGTLMANVVGSFLIGLLLMWFQGRLPISDYLRTGILVGLLGGFTTYSAFSMETINMILALRFAAIGHETTPFPNFFLHKRQVLKQNEK